MNKKVAVILINYKDYAKKYLADCLQGLRQQDMWSEIDLYIVDNSSTVESFEFLQNSAPEANIICNSNNDGFAKGNNDAIKVALSKGIPYILLLNMDTVIEDQKALSNLIKRAELDASAGALQSRLMLWPEKHLINSLGNSSHFLGFGYCNNYRDEYQGVKDLEMHYPSGAAVLFKAEVLKEVGLFDESYFMYNEDQDLGWRIWLANYRCVLVEDSVVYHKYEFGRSINKFYYMDRNRIITILKNYRALTLVLIFPAFIVMELGQIYFSLRNSWFKKKIAVWLYFLNPINLRRIFRSQRTIQRFRKIKDYQIIDKISGCISYQEIDSPALRIANYFFSIYFSGLKFILKVFKI